MPFQLFAVPYFPFDFSCVILIPKSKYWAANIGLQILGCKYWAANELAKQKNIIIILKDFIKQPVIKQSPTFLSFFLIHCYINGFFSFLIKPFLNFEKLIRFHWQAFIVYKNGENLKMLIEIF